MRKVATCIVLLLSVLLTALFMDWGNEPRYANASNQARLVGTLALEIADEFLDGSIDAISASRRIRNLPNIDRAMDDRSVGDANSAMISDIRSLSTSLVLFDGTSARFDDVIERRNAIAEGLRLDRR